jgi:hypothetical protein
MFSHTFDHFTMKRIAVGALTPQRGKVTPFIPLRVDRVRGHNDQAHSTASALFVIAYLLL